MTSAYSEGNKKLRVSQEKKNAEVSETLLKILCQKKGGYVDFNRMGRVILNLLQEDSHGGGGAGGLFASNDLLELTTTTGGGGCEWG